MNDSIQVGDIMKSKVHAQEKKQFLQKQIE
jgi:hypothetical protein